MNHVDPHSIGRVAAGTLPGYGSSPYNPVSGLVLTLPGGSGGMNDGVERVKAASDIVDVVGGYLSLRQAGKTFKAVCPFHDDSRPSLDVDPTRQRYRCWACGKIGRAHV